MRIAVLILGLASATASAGEASAPNLTVALVLDEKGETTPEALDAMKREFARIYPLDQVRFSWRRVGEQISSNRVVVVRIRPSTAPASGTALAFTHISDGAILPFVELDPARIRRMLERAAGPVDSSQGEELIGRSLGRVLAHEAFHVLANTTAHGRKGVTKSSFCAGDLLAERLELEPRAIALIEAGLGTSEPDADREGPAAIAWR